MFGSFGKKKLKIESRSICDRGLARNDNQDCVFEDAKRCLFCVADGMGGGEAGAVASRTVCDAVGGVAAGLDFEHCIEEVDSAILQANAKVRKYAVERGFAQMGSTVAALLIDPTEPAQAAIVNVGDSRVYRRRGIRLERMTEDHRNTAYSHLLTRAVGGCETLQTDWHNASVQKGDVWILCSDGVHEMIPDSTINALVAYGGSASDIAERIEKSVRKAGAQDNYSIVVVRT